VLRAPGKTSPILRLELDSIKLLELNYGDLVRPAFQILPDRGWGQCANAMDEYLIVYGPKHCRDQSICDTSPYILPPGTTTPVQWDCDGFLLPSDRSIRLWRGDRRGPLAIKFWNFRHFEVRKAGDLVYQASWHNGIFEPSQINWAIPNFSYKQIEAKAAASIGSPPL
jgi:hypothetical protein